MDKKNTRNTYFLSSKFNAGCQRQIIFLSTLKNIFLSDVFHAAVLRPFGVLGEVDVGLAFVVMLDAFQVDDHVQGVGQDQQQDEGSDEAHEDGRRQEGGAVARGGELPGGDVEGLDLGTGTETFERHSFWFMSFILTQ